MTKGDPESGKAGQGKKYCYLLRFSSERMADRISELINRGLWEDPAEAEGEMEAEYRKQMSAEFKKKKFDKFTGRYRMVWVCPSGNNHAWDCGKMQGVFATVVGDIPDTISDQFDDPEKKEAVAAAA